MTIGSSHILKGMKNTTVRWERKKGKNKKEEKNKSIVCCLWPPAQLNIQGGWHSSGINRVLALNLAPFFVW